MRIAHIINYFQPRLGYQETFLARRQITDGHDVSMITSNLYYPFPEYDTAYKPLLGDRRRKEGFATEEGIPTYRLKTLFDIRSRVWLVGLERLVAQLKPDLVISHAMLSSSFRIAALKSKGHGFKLIVDDHMDIYAKQDFVGKLYYKWRLSRNKRKLVPWVDRFVGVTRPTCTYFLEGLHGIPKDRIVYIPLGADDDLFRFSQKAREEVRNRLGIPHDAILLLYSGKIHPKKGVDILVRAFDELKRENLYLLLIGEGSEEYKRSMISKLEPNKATKLFLHPFVSTGELPSFYSASDICIWPKETSTSMLDAASCGRPVIGCDVPAVRERTANNNGLTYKTGDHTDLAESIERLCSDEELRISMGQKGRELIEKQFSWKIISKDFIECVS